MDPDWIRIGIQHNMLDPDPCQMKTDPKHWSLPSTYWYLSAFAALCVS
jgi:hypothetical protein